MPSLATFSSLTSPCHIYIYQVTALNDSLLDVNDALNARVAALTEEKTALTAKLTNIIGVIAGLQKISLIDQ